MVSKSAQDQGASVPDQALAVPVKPEDGLDPAGFDPSREAIAAKLDEARALIETRGLAKRAFQSRQGCLCSIGAIRVACTSSPYKGIWSGLVTDCIAYLRRAACGGRVADWNDRAATSQADVVEAFRKAAALARGEAA